MSTSHSTRPKMTPAEFLAWEREQRARFQYVRGEVYAMAGGSPRHNALAANALAHLHAALRGGPCRAFSSDQKLEIGQARAAPTRAYVYADVTVVCGPVQLSEGTNDVIANPAFVIEVLSKSTEAYDRGEKWEGYRQIPTLTDYVLVSQRSAHPEHFARNPDGSWRYRVLEAGDTLQLGPRVEVPIDELYEGAFEIPGDDDPVASS